MNKNYDFDKVVEFIIDTIIDDGMGGRSQVETVLDKVKANVEELSVQETFKIYGEATTDAIKERVLGHIKDEFFKIRYEDKIYKIISKRFVKNKTVFLLELDDDGN